MEYIIDIFRDSILITGLVMVMMLLIEYVHIYSQGRSFAQLQSRPLRQIGLAALLGLVPGCIGGFAAVSLYAHGIISFGALVAMMVCTMGDEAFVLFATVPKVGIALALSLFSLALLSGWLIDKWGKRDAVSNRVVKHFSLHSEDGCEHGAHAAIWGNLRENLRHIQPKRAMLLIGLLLFILAMGLGLLEHDAHLHEHGAIETHLHEYETHFHEPEAIGSRTGHLNIFSERWLNLLFTALSILTLFLTVKASNHFITEHLWDHIIKKHLLKIFLWTFGALMCISIGLQYLHLDEWVVQNGYIVLLVAALIGLIPESGPHLIFIALYASGVAPFSVLFTNFFIQDGHTSLPLLAERKGTFFKAKAIKLILGIAIGSVIYFCGA